MRRALLLTAALVPGWLAGALVLMLLTDESFGGALGSMLPVVVAMAVLYPAIARRSRDKRRRTTE
ncbi:hypothetical protein [Asanoa siamensis]|uniref:Uncharacterized protein n=1 Tax=Asanoa siamensis TaxID=926357 RepID=A0ABQ4CKS5_9ACTN|nr:hypothetical protein [Asanoa siamensis]GIF71452.1 hypothetical protein Asi02nite_09700 [Asanoa siamensis]